MSYSLHEYLQQATYQRLPDEFRSFETVFEAAAPARCPHVIGIDGPTTAGKTSFTNALASFYLRQGVQVATLTLDSFVMDRETHAPVLQDVIAGLTEIADYSDATRDQGAFRRCLVAARRLLTEVVAPGEVVVPNAYNRMTGQNDHDLHVPIPLGGILLAEGIGLHTHFQDLVDTAIRLDVRTEADFVRRILLRERQKPDSAPHLDDDFLAWRYAHVDGPHAVYHRKTSAGRADIVIDTSDFNDMIVYTKAT